MTKIPQQAIEDYIQYWETLTPRSIRLIEKIAVTDMAFSDPFNDVRGIDAVENVLKKMFEDTQNPKFKVQNYGLGQDGNTVFLRWEFSFIPKKSNKNWIINGMSEVVFNHDGKVIGHYDHWDSGSQLLGRLPVIRYVFEFVKRRLTT